MENNKNRFPDCFSVTYNGKFVMDHGSLCAKIPLGLRLESLSKPLNPYKSDAGKEQLCGMQRKRPQFIN